MKKNQYRHINESVVDQKYIATVTRLLLPLKKTNLRIFDAAINKLKRNEGKMFATTAEEYANRMLNPVDITAPTTSKDDMMLSVTNRNKEIIPTDKLIKPQTVKSIWVKELKIDDSNPMKSTAKLEYTYTDGTTSESDINFGVARIAGQYDQEDWLYKNLKRTLSDATNTDILLAMLRVGAGDGRIKWFYGPNRNEDSKWVFEKDADKIISSLKDTVSRAKKWYQKLGGDKAEIWTSGRGTTRIYKTESEDSVEENDMLKGRKHNLHVDEATLTTVQKAEYFDDIVDAFYADSDDFGETVADILRKSGAVDSELQY